MGYYNMMHPFFLISPSVSYICDQCHHNPCTKCCHKKENTSDLSGTVNRLAKPLVEMAELGLTVNWVDSYYLSVAYLGSNPTVHYGPSLDLIF
jgi:hypothetical protein